MMSSYWGEVERVWISSLQNLKRKAISDHIASMMRHTHACTRTFLSDESNDTGWYILQHSAESIYMSLNIDTTCAIYLVFVFKKIINTPSSAPWILHSIGEYYVAAKPFQHKLDPLHRQKFSYKSMYEDT